MVVQSGSGDSRPGALRRSNSIAVRTSALIEFPKVSTMMRRLVLALSLAFCATSFAQQEAVVDVDDEGAAQYAAHHLRHVSRTNRAQHLWWALGSGSRESQFRGESLERRRNRAHGRRAARTGAISRIGLPLPWEPLYPSEGNRYEPQWNDSANSYRSLLIMALPGKQTGVRQQVIFRCIASFDIPAAFIRSTSAVRQKSKCRCAGATVPRLYSRGR